MQPHGSRTRVSRAVDLALSQWSPATKASKTRVVILTDGRLSDTALERSGLARLRQAGRRAWIVDLSDAAPSRALRRLSRASGAEILRAGALTQLANTRADFVPLQEKLAVIGQPKGPQPAPGEQQVQLRRRSRGATRGGPLARAWLSDTSNAAWFAALADEQYGGLRPHGLAFYPAAPYVTAPRAESATPTAMPAESVLQMLRSQLIPKARACLRRDRAGRSDYAVSVQFDLVLQHREVARADVKGRIPAALRSCLDGVLAALSVPAFSGRVRVRYPIHTLREPVAPIIELDPDLAAEIDRTFDRERPNP